MSDLLGIDIAGARGLVSTLDRWSADVDAVVAEIAAAEALADIPTNTQSPLDQIGIDGDILALSIAEAADALESFTISLDSPLTISAALTAIQTFNGTDNDPELDRRVAALRDLVEQHTADDAEAARVMERLLALDQPSDIRFRDTTAVDEARTELERLSAMEVSGAISGNDPRLDEAIAALQDAIGEHTSGDQVNGIFSALLNHPDLATPTLLAAELTGHSIETVVTAHANGLDYDVARGLNALAELDEITESLIGAPPPAITAMTRRRRELLEELAGTDDPEILNALTTLISSGVPAADAFMGLDQQLAVDREQAQIATVSEAFDIDADAAAQLLDEMRADTAALVERGWAIDDAAQIVQVAASGEFDLAEIEALASDDGSSLVEATEKIAQATAAGMTPVEHDAYQGLITHFAVLDNATGGDPDDVVGLRDIEHVVNNPDDFDPDVVAAAAALLAAPMLRHRIDTATENNNVIGADPFGNTRADDNAYSLGDLEQFQFKQAINYLVGDHLDAIDVAQQDGDLSLIDGERSKQDFQTFLDENRGELNEQEILALETVIEAEWYDKGFWEEHKGTITLAAGVIAGGTIFVLTGGVGAPVTAMLISGAYAVGGAVVVGGVTTLGGNAIFGDDLTDDLGQGMLNGGVGGLGGVGLVALPGALASGSLSVKTLAALGGVADVSGLTAAGLFDPALGVFLDDIDLVNFKDHAQTTSLVTGGAAAAGTIVTVGGRRFLVNLADAPTPRPVDFASQGGEFIDDVIRIDPPALSTIDFEDGAARLVGASQAEIPKSKLVDYALNPDHPVGGNKAKVFESALGFNQSNADDLLAQLQAGVMENTPILGKVDDWGVRYTVEIPVIGPNGNIRTVITGWIYKPGSSIPSLTTLLVK